MDPKAEGRLNRFIIRISSILLLLTGIGVLIVEYVFWTKQWLSNAVALVVFVTSIFLFTTITIALLKNRKKLFDFEDDEQ